MESTIVIKVNYEKTLRRFNAHVDEAGKLKLSLDGLREKVLSLFSLSPDVDLTLTYLDEDCDSVTLADDDDLRDIMSQSLNPLRITAEVKSQKSIKNSISSSARSSGNSTPMRSSPKVTQPLPDLNKTFSEIFKAVPEPIGEAISKLSLDLASKAAASSPQIPELVHQFSKMLQSYGKTSIADAESSTSSLITREPEALGGDDAIPKVAPPMPKVAPPMQKVNTIPNSVNQSSGLEKQTHPTLSTPVNNTFVATEPTTAFSVKLEARKAFVESLKAHKNRISKGKTSAGPFDQNAVGQCPFSRMPVANGSAVPYNPFASQLALPPPLRRNSHGGVGGVFHTGVCCDGCGVHPITGPRFKSKVKEDYDLCSNCFAEMGSEAEYIRLDHPVPYRHYPLKKPLFGHVNSLVNPPPPFPLVKPKHPKLDSRFIMDVNVVDGTMMAPSTPFTKIWRMRNNGTLVWPQGTQLVWIGGDKLSASLSAGLQIPVDGLAVENELEVAVDFTAPELPGRYISYWRMSTLSGQKFGQRVWVLIQVDASVTDSASNGNSASNSNWQGLNLNFPPQSGDDSVTDNVDSIVVNGRLPTLEPSNINNVEHTPVDGRVPIHELSNKDNDLVEPLVVPVPTKDQDQSQDLDFPINDNLLVVGPTTVVSYPIVDSSDVPPVEAYMAPPTAPAEAEKDEGVEQILLRELEEMGFKQVALNKEILRMNEYNLEQSVDDLCGVSEWDPILEELQEMGFCDDEMNKKLLKKNNGSIKDVVMDLINGEKA